ncbi:Hypothetical predicted protein [Olea europaea subsp. europaea]|uniref:Uncharacterized protein n=1 Tax=Olea europaea subsp. europaea TaxID=158383 RepID=A0A8S0PGA0_OLEEU|nr:Hypothetical predicted protein [Olea europaea subsp. europaea]
MKCPTPRFPQQPEAGGEGALELPRQHLLEVAVYPEASKVIVGGGGPRFLPPLPVQEYSEPSELTTTASASTAFNEGYESHDSGGSTGARSGPSVQSNTKSCTWSTETKGDGDRVACRSQCRCYGSLGGGGGARGQILAQCSV